MMSMRKILRGIAGILIAVDVTMFSFTNISFAKDMYGVNDVQVQQNVQEQQTINTVQNEQEQQTINTVQSTQEQYAESGRTSISKPDMEELRQLYNSLPTYDKLYKTEPVVEGTDYHIAVLSDEAYDTAKGLINYYRRVAGLGDITLSDDVNESAAYGALALAMNNSGLTHYPSQPKDMSSIDYNKAYAATTSSNLSSASGYSEKRIISLAVSGQIGDSDSSNIGTLGHRRWLLNPGVKTLGIGSANNNYNYYTDIRVFGDGIQSESVNDYDFIAWPSSGANLTDTFPKYTPWSVTLNPKVYYTPTDVSVEVKSLRYGTTWYFDNNTGYGTSSVDNYFNIERSRYGVANCIIFRPAYQYIDMFKGDYIVTVSNVRRKDTGEYTNIQYKVTFDNYDGTVSINDCDISLAQDSYEYEGQKVEPEVTVKDKFTGKILEKDTDYIVRYYYNNAVGTANAYVRGINKYTGSSTLGYEIKQGDAQLSVDIEKKNIQVDEYAQIIVNSRAKKYEYISDNTSVAIISYGRVKGVAEGTANITVSVADSNYKPEQVTLQVTVSEKKIEITEVLLNKYAETLTEGDTITLSAEVLPYDTTYSKNVSWSSSNEAVATVSADGTVTAKSAGTAIITATSENGMTASCTITVEKKFIPITEVYLDKSSATLTEGDTATLTATVLPENTTYSKDVSWSSSNVAVATVDLMGKVTAKSAGTAIITATTENGMTASCTITVNKKDTNIAITEVRLNKSAETLVVGETTTLTATVLPENTTDSKNVSWSSGNSEVAIVDVNGTVIAKSTGTAVITATTTNGKTASCTVTVNKKDTYTGLRDVDGQLKYFNNGNIDTTYTGFADYEGSRHYVSNGVVDTTYTSLILDNGNWVYVENGSVNNDYTGLVNYEGLWFYVSDGTIDWGYTGLADYNGIWFYVSGGIVDWNYTGLTYYNDVWFYISGGMIDWDYTGLVYYNDIWFYVSGGILDWDYIGLTSYNGIWFMISGGMINWDYAGLVYYNDMWFYVLGGTINWDYAGLIYYNDAWFYVSGGTINWTTAIVDYNGAKFYVQNGMVDWDYTGTVNYNGSTYNVINGMA